MVHSSSSRPISLPVITDVPHDGFNSDDSDEEVVSRAHSVRTTSAVDAAPMTIPPTTPADRPISPTPGNSTSNRHSRRPSVQPYHSNESFNQQNLIRAPLIRVFDLGQELKTKNWSISKMTANHARRGSRSAPDYDVIHRYAKSAGTSWANVRPTWHGNSSARTGGRGLNDCGNKMQLRLAAIWIRWSVLITPVFHFFLFFHLSVFPLIGLSMYSHYGSPI